MSKQAGMTPQKRKVIGVMKKVKESPNPANVIDQIMWRYDTILAQDGLAVSVEKRNAVRMLVTEAADKQNLNTEKLMSFDNGNFMHDIIGIYNHWTGEKFKECFWPRCGSNKKAVTTR